MPMVLAAVLGTWSFSLIPRPEATQLGGRSLDSKAFALRSGEFKLRLPGSPPTIANLQPETLKTPFKFLENLPHFRESSLERWGRKEFLWISALEFGLWFGCGALLTHLVGYLILWLRGLDPDTIAIEQGEHRNHLFGLVTMASCAFIAAFTGGVLFLAIISEVLWRIHDQPYAVAMVGPPLALLVFVVTTFIEVWLLGRWESDDLREWWARICAWLLIYAAGWLALFAITLYGPMLANRLLHWPWLRSGAALSWLATAAGGAFAARRTSTQGSGGSRLLKVFLGIAPTVFVVGLLVIVSMLGDGLIFVRQETRLDSLNRALASRRVAVDTGADPSASWVYWNGS